MAKVNNLVMDGTQGTLQGLTFVKSRRYGNHVRAKRGTIKPAVLNDTLTACKDRLQQAGSPARLIFNAIKEEHKDGGLWSRLLSVFNKDIKDGKAVGVACLRDLECSQERQLSSLVGSFSLTIEQSNNTLQVAVKMDHHAHWKRKPKFIDGYQLSLVVLFPDFAGNRLHSETVCGAITKFDAPLPGLYSLQVPVVAWATEYVVFMKLTACAGVTLVKGPTTKGMRVVGMGEVTPN
jgi:hypothetical protein